MDSNLPNWVPAQHLSVPVSDNSPTLVSILNLLYLMLKYKTFNAQIVYGLYFLMLRYKAFSAQSVYGLYGLYFF
jgi:hypothetical protein